MYADRRPAGGMLRYPWAHGQAGHSVRTTRPRRVLGTHNQRNLGRARHRSEECMMRANSEAPPTISRRRTWRSGIVAATAVILVGGGVVAVTTNPAAAAVAVDTNAWYVLL